MVDNPTPPWYRLTPDWLIPGLLALEGLLWLSQRFGWPAWHKGYAVLTAVASVSVVMLLMLVWFGAALVFRWRFQFSIRSLLLLTVVVALPCSWLSSQVKRAREQKDAIEAIGGRSGWVGYDFERRFELSILPDSPKTPVPAWLCDALGIDFFADVTIAFVYTEDGVKRVEQLPELQLLRIEIPGITPAELGRIGKLSQLLELDLEGSDDITDAGLAFLGKLPQLQRLNLVGVNCTDAGLSNVENLTQLRDLDLRCTPITDAGLRHLEKLVHLEVLDLRGTEITDAGLGSLAHLGHLQELRLPAHGVTDKSTEKLRQAVPDCEITIRD